MRNENMEKRMGTNELKRRIGEQDEKIEKLEQTIKSQK